MNFEQFDKACAAAVNIGAVLTITTFFTCFGMFVNLAVKYSR